jgi:hypothetical protein
LSAQVSINSKVEAPKPSLTPEEMKQKAQELRYGALKCISKLHCLHFVIATWPLVLDNEYTVFCFYRLQQATELWFS